MRFLVTSMSRDVIPPEMLLPMIEMMKGWIAEHRGSGKMETVFGFAGQQGGGAIVDVVSHEELDEIVGGFPFLPFSEMTVHPLSDLDAALDNAAANIRQMLEMMGGAG
jgi:muconolactone delta-isomerase